MAEHELVELEGHIIDSLLLAKVLDLILAAGADYQLVEVDVGKTTTDASRARIEVQGSDAASLDHLLEQLQVHGVNRVAVSDARVVVADTDGALPTGFYPTTNLATSVRVNGHWIEVENPEMDCALVVSEGRARTVPMHRVHSGDRVVVGRDGVRVQAPQPPHRSSGVSPFEFMTSEVSSEKPKGLLVAEVAGRIRRAKAAGGRVLAVCGPAVVHTGAADDLACLVRAGWVDVVFAGNGFAAHDIEANVLGTSLGVSVIRGTVTEEGHANHLRVINEVRRRGSIAAAVDDGFLAGGVMYECVRAGVPFVLGAQCVTTVPCPTCIPTW